MTEYKIQLHLQNIICKTPFMEQNQNRIKKGLLELMGGYTDVAITLANIREIERLRNENPRDIEPPFQADKDINKDETLGGIIVGAKNAEDISLSFARQGLRMIPTNTFGN